MSVRHALICVQSRPVSFQPPWPNGNWEPLRVVVAIVVVVTRDDLVGRVVVIDVVVRVGVVVVEREGRWGSGSRWDSRSCGLENSCGKGNL